MSKRPGRIPLVSEEFTRIAGLLEDLGRPREAKWIESVLGQWDATLHYVGELEGENVALRQRVALLSNAAEAALRQLDREKGIDPDREVLCGLIYSALEQGVPDDALAPENNEDEDVFDE